MVLETIRTRRLAFRPIAESDAQSLHELWTHPEVRRFLWDGAAIPWEQTLEIVKQNEALFAAEKLGIWGLREPEGEELIGFAGYWYFREPPVRELLYGLRPTHWNRGLATEAARRVIEHGFEVLGFERVETSIDFPNSASIRVAEKLGMTRSGRAVVDGLDTVYFTLVREGRGDGA